MEQLKPILKYQFWILLAIALILPIVGWFMSTSGLVAEAATRTKALQDTYGKLTANPDDPNTDWARGVEEVNKDQEKQKLIAWNEVWERQKELMTWPPRMISDPAQFQNWHLEIYRQAYRPELEKIRQIVKPMDETGSNGLVEFSEELPFTPEWEGQSRPPTPTQIAAAQEDLWLFKALLECIAKVNSGSSTAFDAPIRRIDLVNLRGGSKGGASGGGTAKSSSSGGPNDQMKVMESAMSSMKGFRMGGMSAKANQGTGGGAGITDARIEADSVLGPEATASMSSTSTSTSSTTSTSKDATKQTDLASQEKARYREQTKEWKTRGFELQVTMDHRHIPELLVALSNCDWPLSLMRVQEADAQDEDLVPADSSGDSRMPQMSSGMRGMGMPMPMGMGGTGPAMNTKMANPLSMAMPGAAGSGSSSTKKIATPAATSRPAKSARRDDDEEGPMGGGIERSPLDDPNLAVVSVVGVIYIFKEPDKPAVQPGPAPAAAPGSLGAPAAPGNTVAAPANGVAAGAPAAAATADPTAPAPGDEATEEAADDEDEMKDEAKPAESEDAPAEGEAAEKPAQPPK